MQTKLDFPVPVHDFYYPLWQEGIDLDGLLFSWYGLWRRDTTLAKLGAPKNLPIKIDSGVYSAVKSGVKLPTQEEYIKDALARCEGYDVTIIQQDVVDDARANIKKAAEFLDLSEKYSFTPMTVIQAESIPDYITAFHEMLQRGLLTDYYSVGGLLFIAKYLPQTHISYLIKYFQTHSDKKQHVLGYYKSKFSSTSIDSNVPLIYAEKGIRWKGPYKQVKVSNKFKPEILVENYKTFRHYIQKKESPVQPTPRPTEPLTGTLRPFQQEVVDTLPQAQSIVVSASVGSGKTYLATEELPRLGRTVVVEPYRAIVSEFAQTLEGTDLSVAIRYEGRSEMPEDWNLFLTTYASYRMMLERPQSWQLETIKHVVIDEAHLLEGHPLETLVSMTRALLPGAKIIIMSGTLVPGQFKEWLDPALVTHKSDLRVEREVKLSSRMERDVQEFYEQAEKPVLIFSATKKKAQKMAAELYHYNSNLKDSNALDRINTKGLKKKQDGEYIALAERRIGLHHGGLEETVRKFVEQNYRDGNLDAICATTTLSAGVNLPAKSVLLEGKQYSRKGFTVDINTILQIEGRLRQGGKSVILLPYDYELNRDEGQALKEYLETTFTPREVEGKGSPDNEHLAFIDSLHGSSLYCSADHLKSFTRQGITRSRHESYQLLKGAGIVVEDEESGKFQTEPCW